MERRGGTAPPPSYRFGAAKPGTPSFWSWPNDIVYYAPEFDLFLPGDTGSSRAVGPPRWGILVVHILKRAPGWGGRTASRMPELGRYHFGCTRSAGDCEASAVYTDGGPGGDRR